MTRTQREEAIDIILDIHTFSTSQIKMNPQNSKSEVNKLLEVLTMMTSSLVTVIQILPSELANAFVKQIEELEESEVITNKQKATDLKNRIIKHQNDSINAKV